MKVLKAALLLCGLIFVMPVQAETSEISLAYEKESPYTMEPSFTVSSINGGSQFVGVALTSRLTPWMRVGMEGELPANFDDRAQIYTGRLLARVPLLDRTNKIFLQGSMSVSFYNLNDRAGEFASETFGNLEFLVGYRRKLTRDWSLGAMLGAQYSNIDSYVFNDSFSDGLYNRASIVGSYIF